MHIEFSGRSDVGRMRSNNEDTFLVNSTMGYGLVADGMGGAAAGETASRIFAETAAVVFDAQTTMSQQAALEWVQATFAQANDRILAHVAQCPEHEGMGCTAEVVAFSPHGFVVGHMGDSRTYQYRDGRLIQLTKDHSLVQEQIDQGTLTPEQARSHRMRNVILRAVGVRPSPALDTISGAIEKDDLFLLCSDGLTDMVEDEQILTLLRGDGDLERKVDNLVDYANRAGGKDNITAVLAQIR